MSVKFDTRTVGEVLVVNIRPNFWGRIKNAEDVVEVFGKVTVTDFRKLLLCFKKVKRVDADALRAFATQAEGLREKGLIIKGFDYKAVKDFNTAKRLAEIFGFSEDQAAAVRNFW